jgi:hypothetical protein
MPEKKFPLIQGRNISRKERKGFAKAQRILSNLHWFISRSEHKGATNATPSIRCGCCRNKND